MDYLILCLLLVVGLVNLICWIIVLTKLFPAEGPLLGILGILCGIYAFIWGWMHAGQHGIKKIMQIWTACAVVGIILRVVFMGMWYIAK